MVEFIRVHRATFLVDIPHYKIGIQDFGGEEAFQKRWWCMRGSGSRGSDLSLRSASGGMEGDNLNRG